jgi:hypothetical protein
MSGALMSKGRCLAASRDLAKGKSADPAPGKAASKHRFQVTGGGAAAAQRASVAAYRSRCGLRWVMIEGAATLSPAAMRMRRSRERRRDGLRCLRVEIRTTEIDGLVRRGFLKSEARNERKTIIEALHAFFESELDITV